jgi:hypothetical protein
MAPTSHIGALRDSRLDEMKIGNIHELKMLGVRSADGKGLLHSTG